jgi:PAS domain S-box-containing protein
LSSGAAARFPPHSTHGKGSGFVFNVPRDDVLDDSDGGGRKMADEHELDEDSSSGFLPLIPGADQVPHKAKQCHVLVIEDDTGDYETIARCLSRAEGIDFRIERAIRFADGLQRLADGGIDVVLLDINLPDSRGLETFQKLHFQAPQFPVIVLTGHPDESIGIQAAREGAQDYLVKGEFDDNLLVRSIRYSMARNRSKVRLARTLQLARTGSANLRNIINSSADGMLVVDSMGIILFSNPTADALFGHSAGELLGGRFVIPLTSRRVTEEVISSSDGRNVPVEMRVVEMSWEGRLSFLVTLRDQTGQKQAEAERARLVAIARSTEDAVMSADLDGIVRSWNPGAEKMFGYSADEMLGQPVSILALEEERHKAIAFIERVKGGETINQAEAKRLRKDGKTIVVSLSVFPIRDMAGKIVSIGGIVRDITERQRARKAAAESEARYRSLYEDSPIPLREEDLSGLKVYIDELRDSGTDDFKEYFDSHPEAVDECARMIKITDVNAATLRLYGAQAEDEFQGRFAASFDESSHGPFAEELVAISEGKRKFECETTVRTFAGEEKSIALRWRAAPGYENTLSRVWVSTVDLTDFKRAQDVLQRNQLQMTVAQAIQQRLLPQAPAALAGFDIAGALYPAYFAAGDYFDYLPMLDGSMGFAIGDVSGHGFGPALLMATTSAHLQSLVQLSDDLGEIFRLLNHALFAKTDPEYFVTLLLAKLDAQTRSLVYTSAGHRSGYVLDSSGEVTAELESVSLPIAITPDAEFPVGAPIDLHKGDVVVLLTDGFVETRSCAGEYFKTERMLDVVRANRSRAASEIIESLYQAVQDFSGFEALDDDLTAVVIKVDS